MVGVGAVGVSVAATSVPGVSGGVGVSSVGEATAVACGVSPLYEVEDGVYTINRKPKELKPVKDYMAKQGRFRHLPQEELDAFQAQVTKEWNILLKKEEFTKSLVSE